MTDYQFWEQLRLRAATQDLSVRWTESSAHRRDEANLLAFRKACGWPTPLKFLITQKLLRWPTPTRGSPRRPTSDQLSQLPIGGRHARKGPNLTRASNLRNS